MFRLSREVRFAINAVPDDQLLGRATNGFAGFPSLTGLGHTFALTVTLEAPAVDPASQYVRNIIDVDDVVRRMAVPLVARHVRENTFGGGGHVVLELVDALHNGWPGRRLQCIELAISPFVKLHARPGETMVRLSQQFEFSAAHRLHNPKLDDAANRDTFGKCNNLLGHGHNYVMQVTVTGEPATGAGGVLIWMPAFERIVNEAVIDRFDHKHLNEQVPEFRETIPSVENIARVAYGLLKPRFERERVKLASVTVWETSKTWCEYAEP